MPISLGCVLSSRACRSLCEVRIQADALRRHQKSRQGPLSEPSFERCLRNYRRHNGVVIEPPKQPRRSTSIPSPTDGSGPSRSPSMAEPEAGPSRSQSEPSSASSMIPPVAVGHARGNYYRQHTMSPGAHLMLSLLVQFLRIGGRIWRSTTTAEPKSCLSIHNQLKFSKRIDATKLFKCLDATKLSKCLDATKRGS